jgi:UDP-N-acetylglucosamine:LPS N-acetylglucosamine transferase
MLTEKLWHRIRSVVFTAVPEQPEPSASEARAAGHSEDRREVKFPKARAPRILILTSELGAGHARAAEAIRLAIREMAPEATVCMVDWWSLMHASVAREAKEMYMGLVLSHPDLYERIYHLGERTWRELLSSTQPLPLPVQQLFEHIRTLHIGESRRRARGPYRSDRALYSLFCTTPGDPLSFIAGGMLAKLALIKWSWGRLARRLRVRIQKFEADVIVSTQMIPAALVSAIKVSSIKQQRRLAIPSVAVPTDFGVHDFWSQPHTDLYCIAHESLTELPPGLNSARVAATGIPLMPEFSKPVDAREAREQLGLNQEIPVVLVLGGGLGLGVESVAEQLLRTPIDMQVLVLRGRNASALAKLDALRSSNATRLRVYDWTDRVGVFIRAADIVVGKPGGLSVAEVLACGRPFLAMRSLHGQESFNVRFLERHNVGRLLSDNELSPTIDTLLRNPEELAALKEHAWQLGCRGGAERIAERVLELAIATSERDAWRAGWQSYRAQ